MNDFYYGMYRCCFSSFVDFAFRELHPGEKMDDNWHIGVISDLLHYLWINPDPDMGRKLVFNLPPGYLKVSAPRSTRCQGSDRGDRGDR